MSVFKFKKFTIQQEKTAMKVGTDAVLLGSWCSLKNTPDTILDVGAGTGVISLIMAQRSKATTIDAVEIEENAYQQTVENFEASAWGDRLFCYHSSFQNFVREMQEENESMNLLFQIRHFIQMILKLRIKPVTTQGLLLHFLLKNC